MAAILAVLTITIMPKTMDTELVHGLSHAEFRCKCGRKWCHYTLVANSLIDSYGNLRRNWGRPLTIISGFRCQFHNQKVGGVFISSHTTGHAIDIATNTYTETERQELIRLARDNFDVVIIYPSFIHCHNDAA